MYIQNIILSQLARFHGLLEESLIALYFRKFHKWGTSVGHVVLPFFYEGRLHAPVLQRFVEETDNSVHVNICHFKAQAHGLVPSCGFGAFFHGNSRESGKKRVACGINEGLCPYSAEALHGLDDALGDFPVLCDSADEGRVVENGYACFLTHFLVN